MYMLWFKFLLWFEFSKTGLNFLNWSENCRDRKANTLGQSELIMKVNVWPSHFKQYYFKDIHWKAQTMHAWLYMYIEHVEYTGNYGCKRVALEHKPFRDSICHKSCMTGQFSLCLYLTYLPVLHQPSTEAPLMFFFTYLTKILNKHAGYATLSWPKFDIGRGTWRGTTIIITVMSPMKDHKINYCSTHLLTLAEIFELGFQTWSFHHWTMH